jgi:HPt (histidine-containing phosphotransfer) domain-containing protein
MNVKKISENFGLSEDKCLYIVELFVKTSAANLKDLAEALENRDTENVVTASHSLKGAAGTLGFQEIYERAKFIELNARLGILEGIKEALISLKEFLALIEENLKKTGQKKS